MHFIDKPQLDKVRPVLIVDMLDNPIVVALKITSQEDLNPNVMLAIKNWEHCGLRKPSFVRLDQLFELNEKDLLHDERIGTVSSDFLEQVRATLVSKITDY